MRLNFQENSLKEVTVNDIIIQKAVEACTL
jgi:hypothetical protein